jgi:hypothetical protein
LIWKLFKIAKINYTQEILLRKLIWTVLHEIKQHKYTVNNTKLFFSSVTFVSRNIWQVGLKGTKWRDGRKFKEGEKGRLDEGDKQEKNTRKI